MAGSRRSASPLWLGLLPLALAAGAVWWSPAKRPAAALVRDVWHRIVADGDTARIALATVPHDPPPALLSIPSRRSEALPVANDSADSVRAVAAENAAATSPARDVQRFLLVVGCLGDADRTYRIEIAADDRSDAPSATLEPYEAPPQPAPRAAPVPRGTGIPARGLADRSVPPSIPPEASTAAPDPHGAGDDFDPNRRFDARPPRRATERTATPFDRFAAEPARGSGATRRRWSLHVHDGPLDDPAQYATFATRTIREGRAVRVHLDESVPESALEPGALDEIVETLEGTVLPRLADSLGPTADVDGDGRLAVVLTPWLQHLQGGRTRLGGLVRSSDFRADLDAPFGNRADVLFLDAALAPGAALRTLLAHETAHVATCGLRARPAAGGAPLPPEEDWLSEAQAHLAENLHGGDWSNLDHRIARFLDAPERCPLVVPDYFRAGRWRDHGCRGATYLFLRWCTEEFGTEILPAMVRTPAVGTENVAAATGLAFPELFRRWTLHLAETGHPELAPGGSAPQSAPASGSALPPLSLRGRVGTFDVSGPRVVSWTHGEPPLVLEIAGTAPAFVEIVVPRGTGTRDAPRVRVAGEPGSRPQWTIRSLPR